MPSISNIYIAGMPASTCHSNYTQHIMPWLKIPPEVLERILTYLDVESIKRLRLVNRSLSKNCIGPYFRSFIRQPTIDLTTHSFAALDALLSTPWVEHSIHTLTILATSFDSSNAESKLAAGGHKVYDSDEDESDYVPYSTEELADIQSELDWLNAQTKARENESQNSIVDVLVLIFRRLKSLNTIRLDAAIIPGPNSKESITVVWRPCLIWTRATQVHFMTMSAIVRSGISVSRLNIYRDTLRCSVPLNDYAISFGSGDLRSSFANLDALELSIASTEHGDTRDTTTIEDNLPVISRLLKWTPKLRKLNLHVYRTARADTEIDDEIFTSIADTVHLPRLQECSLSGFYLTVESLLQFLTKHSTIQHLTLEELHLTSGLWEPIFAHISRRMPSLTNLHLSSMWDGGLVNLHPVWQTEDPEDRSTGFPCLWGGLVVHTRSFTMEELQKGLKFRSRPRGRTLGSTNIAQWRRRRRAEYGLTMRAGEFEGTVRSR